MTPRLLVLFAAAVVLCACGEPAVMPPGFLVNCRVDADCGAPYQCLPRPDGLRSYQPDERPDGVCSQACVTKDTCPLVRGCADQRACTAGVCDFWRCA